MPGSPWPGRGGRCLGGSPGWRSGRPLPAPLLARPDASTRDPSAGLRPRPVVRPTRIAPRAASTRHSESHREGKPLCRFSNPSRRKLTPRRLLRWGLPVVPPPLRCIISAHRGATRGHSARHTSVGSEWGAISSSGSPSVYRWTEAQETLEPIGWASPGGDMKRHLGKGGRGRPPAAPRL